MKRLIILFVILATLTCLQHNIRPQNHTPVLVFSSNADSSDVAIISLMYTAQTKVWRNYVKDLAELTSPFLPDTFTENQRMDWAEQFLALQYYNVALQAPDLSEANYLTIAKGSICAGFLGWDMEAYIQQAIYMHRMEQNKIQLEKLEP